MSGPARVLSRRWRRRLHPVARAGWRLVASGARSGSVARSGVGMLVTVLGLLLGAGRRKEHLATFRLGPGEAALVRVHRRGSPDTSFRVRA